MPGYDSSRARTRERLRAVERELARQDAATRRGLAELHSTDRTVTDLALTLLGALDPSASPDGPVGLGRGAHVPSSWRRA